MHDTVLRSYRHTWQADYVMDERTHGRTDAVTVRCGVVLGGPPNKLQSLVECCVLHGELLSPSSRSSCRVRAASRRDDCSDTFYTAAAAAAAALSAKRYAAFTQQIKSFISLGGVALPSAAQRPTNRFLFWLSRRIILVAGTGGRVKSGWPVYRRFGHISDRSPGDGGGSSTIVSCRQLSDDAIDRRPQHAVLLTAIDDVLRILTRHHSMPGPNRLPALVHR